MECPLATGKGVLVRNAKKRTLSNSEVLTHDDIKLKLKHIKELYAEGLIDKDEYKDEKKKLLKQLK